MWKASTSLFWSPSPICLRRLRAQLGIKAFIKRLAILHASKLVALAAFAAAMHAPGALGGLLLLGLVALAPLLGDQARGAAAPQALLGATLAGAQLLALVWLVAQYALLVPWVQQALLQLFGAAAVDWAAWAGLVMPGGSGGSGGASPATIERLLRAQALLLLAVALRRRAARWQRKLPPQVAAVGYCGAACPLFWPPAPGHAAASLGEGSSSSGELESTSPRLLSPTRLQQLSLVASVRLALADLSARARAATQQALRAVDWPEAATGVPGEAGRPQLRAPPPAPAQGAAAHPGHARLRGQLRALRFAAQDWLECAWSELGLEISLFLLLLTAFSAADALSLLLMAFLALGMAATPATQRQAWAFGLVPLLGLALAGEYAVRVGPPPPLGTTDGQALGMSEGVWVSARMSPLGTTCRDAAQHEAGLHMAASCWLLRGWQSAAQAISAN